MARPEFELVFARYAEATAFLDRWPHAAVIYNKGENDFGSPHPVVRLPNVGMESHTYLHHCAARYDDLAEVTLFLCGSWTKRPENVLLPLERYAVRPLAAAPAITAARYHSDDGWPGRVQHWGRWERMLGAGEIRPSPYTLGEWWRRVIGGPPPKTLYYIPGATFSVSREHIRRRPRAWYAALAEFFAQHQYPEEVHYIERMWLHVFRAGGRWDVDLGQV